jgi:Phosphate-selective porin O and P
MRALNSIKLMPSYKVRIRQAALSIATLVALGGATISADATEMYVDTETKQVFTAPGVNRVKLSEFEEVNAVVGKIPPEEVKALETKLRQKKKMDEAQAKEELTAALKPKQVWTDAITVRGYTQLRYAQPISGDRANLVSRGDEYLANNQGFGVRRARLIFFGDVSDHLYWYAQTEFNGLGTGSAIIRDSYADISFDDRKEHRVRAGISKVPFGFEILQSSQNRLSFDRSDALNSAARDERDMGLIYMWAPAEIRDRFRDLVRSGLKGTGDYGVLATGVYNGQGLNKAELNDSLHAVARASYPFKLDSGQFVEAGVSAFSGRFVPTRATGGLSSSTTTPTLLDNPFATNTTSTTAGTTNTTGKGQLDERVAAHIVYYPQPFGFQAEWNVGRTPTLNRTTRATISPERVGGGYLQTMYRTTNAYGNWTPYLKWQKFDGAEKLSTNVPYARVNEKEVGFEWQPLPELELTVAYADMHRTNLGIVSTAISGNSQVKADMVRVQLQWNY